MKLPTDPKMRAQILILVGLVVVVFLVLAYFGFSTILSDRNNTRVKLAAAVKQLDKIDQEVNSLPALRQSRDSLFWSIQHAATNYILFHEYRNYHLTAREVLIPLAAEMAISIDIPKEGVIDHFPISDAKNTNRVARSAPQDPKDYSGPISPVFALYPVTLTGRAGFPRLLTFLRRIESMNPYLTVSELRVRADSKTPEEQEFALTLLWPIWKNLEQKPKVGDLISPAQDYGSVSESN